MSTLSGQGNLNKLTQQQQVNLTGADQLSPTPLVVSDASSVAPWECSAYNWGFNFPVTKIFEIDELLQQEIECMSQTRDTNPNWESSSTSVPQHFNSHHRDGALSFEPDPTRSDLAEEASNVKNQLHKAGIPSQACIGKKRNAGQPILLIKKQELERMQKKREADKKYRADIRRELNEYRSMKPQYDRLMEVMSRFGGIDQVESQINRLNSELHRIQQKEVDYDMPRKLVETELNQLEQMKSKYGGINEMEFMLDKFKELEAESKRLELIKSKYGGIEKMESMLDRYMQMEAESHKLNRIKSQLGIQETESILQKLKEMEDELHRLDHIKSSFDGIDEIEPGINRLGKIELEFEKHKQMVNQKAHEPFRHLDGPQASNHCGVNLNSFTTECNTHYSDALVDHLITRLTDENVGSNLDTSSFQDLLDEEWESVNKYKIPSALVCTAHNIFEAYGDITKNCKLSGLTVRTIFVLLCAAIKEMGDLSLDQVTEEIIWKLRDPIMDAKRSGFDVEFAMEYLKTVAQGYFGLKARRDYNNLKQTVASLRADEEALRKMLEKKSREIKATEAMQRDLTSEKSRVCRESADKIMCKTVSIF